VSIEEFGLFNCTRFMRNCVLLSFVLLALFPSRCFSCELIEGFIDYNCDGQHKVVFTGDSVVLGFGDRENRNKGGYVKRLDEVFPESKIVNLGVGGITTLGLLRAFKQNLKKAAPGTTKKKTKSSDVIVIDVGRNDFGAKVTAGMAVRNVARIVKFLRKELGKNGTQPFIVVTTLIPTKRINQGKFIKEFNRLLLKFKGRNLPVHIRLDKLKKKIIAKDGLHPKSAGYETIQGAVATFLQNKLQTLLAKKREDDDADGIYDLFESTLFGTDPNNGDTDGDTFLDGFEIFSLGSDPLDPLDPPPPVP